MKKFFLLILFTSFLFSDYLLHEYNVCVTSYQDINANKPNRKNCKTRLSSDNSIFRLDELCSEYTFIDNYAYDDVNDTCYLPLQDYENLGITQEQYNLIMLLFSSFVGMIIIIIGLKGFL